MRVGLAVPVDHGERFVARILDAIASQSLRPDEVWIAETGPTDATRRLVEERGARYLPVPREGYDHGGTRSDLAARCRCDLLVLMSQDALPVGGDALERLVHPLRHEPELAAVYGRQIAPAGSHPFTVLKREFLYPAPAADVAGAPALRRPFLSNAFAAYRRDALEGIGYFGTRRLMCEDVVAAAMLVRAGHRVRYVPDAAVEHANDFALALELRRYFDIGACHAAEPWIDAQHGAPGSEGRRFVAFGVRWLVGSGRAHLVPSFCAWGLLKRAAYAAGRRHDLLPAGLAARLSGLPQWWRRDGEPRPGSPPR